jgi:hypothetical protein
MNEDEQEYLYALGELKSLDFNEDKWLVNYFELYKLTLNWPTGLPPINRTNLIEGTHRNFFNFNYTEILKGYDYKFDNHSKQIISLCRKNNI